MARTNKKLATVETTETMQTAAASMSMLGQLTAAADVTPAAPTVRHYGGAGAGTVKQAGTYVLSPAGAKRLATQAAKRDLDSRYACAFQLAELLAANSNVSSAQYMEACTHAGCADASGLAFSKRGSTANAAEVWRYYVAKKLLIPA
jgi:hypothetical protein